MWSWGKQDNIILYLQGCHIASLSHSMLCRLVRPFDRSLTLHCITASFKALSVSSAVSWHLFSLNTSGCFSGHFCSITGRDEFDVSLLERVIDDGFVLFHHDWASRVDDVTSRATVRVYSIDRSQQQFFLESRATDRKREKEILYYKWRKTLWLTRKFSSPTSTRNKRVILFTDENRRHPC